MKNQIYTGFGRHRGQMSNLSKLCLSEQKAHLIIWARQCCLWRKISSITLICQRLPG